jgi:hypothetical protein
MRTTRCHSSSSRPWRFYQLDLIARGWKLGAAASDWPFLGLALLWTGKGRGSEFIGGRQRRAMWCDGRVPRRELLTCDAVNLPAWIDFGLCVFFWLKSKLWANDCCGSRFIAWLKKSRQILGWILI